MGIPKRLYSSKRHMGMRVYRLQQWIWSSPGLEKKHISWTVTLLHICGVKPTLQSLETQSRVDDIAMQSTDVRYRRTDQRVFYDVSQYFTSAS